MSRKRFLLGVLAALSLAGAGLAGTSNLDRLDIQPEAASGDAFRVLDNSGSELFVVEEGGTVDFGAAAPAMAVSKSVFLGAGAIDFGTTGASEIKNNKATIGLADASADEHIYISWGIPDDMDTGSDVTVQVVYLCDQGSPTEGEWTVTYLAVADDDADAALGNELTVLDTAAAQDDWNVTGVMTVPAAAIGASDTSLQLDVYHDVSDPLCGGEDVNVLGVLIGYTTASNY